VIHVIETTMNPGVQMRVEDSEYADLKSWGVIAVDHTDGEANATASEPAAQPPAADNAESAPQPAKAAPTQSSAPPAPVPAAPVKDAAPADKPGGA
jgi:hypothetical protein